MEAMKAVSRTAWESFIRCKRCFYLERKLKIKSIGMPGYPINSRVDALLKNEFDIFFSACEIIALHITDIIPMVHGNQNMLIEGAQGTLLDIDQDK